MTTESILSLFTFPALKSIKPITRLNSAHTTLTVDEESPLPGGLAKGVGNLFPQIPCTKWGTTFAKNAPAKKQAKY